MNQQGMKNARSTLGKDQINGSKLIVDQKAQTLRHFQMPMGNRDGLEGRGVSNILHR